MSLRKAFICFLVSLPLCVAVRFFQIVTTVDYSNGFFINGREIFGYLALLFILLVCAALVFISFKTFKEPIAQPKTGWLIVLFSGYVSGRLFWQLFGEVMSFSMPAWQVLVVKVVTVVTMIYFSLLFWQKLLKFKLPPMIHIIPAIYAIIKTIFTFINISSLSVISDNVLLMACYCVLMLFFINYARIYNGVQVKGATKKIMGYGFLSAVLCFTNSLPTILISAFTGEQYLHSNSSVNNTFLAFGFFIVIFLCEYLGQHLNKEEHID